LSEAPITGGSVTPEGRMRALTSLKRQENSAHELLTSSLQAILENLTEAVTVADGEGRVILRNRTAREMLRLAEDAVQLSCHVVLRYPDGTLVPPNDYPIARALRGEEIRGLEFSVERRDGVRRIFQFSGATIYEGKRPSLVVITYRDVTDARRYAEQQHDYLRATSHDLRNPLSVLLAQAQLLEMETRRKGLHDENKAARLILQSGRRISSMLDDLIESLKYDAGLWSIRPRETDLKKLVADVVDRYRGSSTGKRIHLEIPDLECRAMVDPDQVERCLENLLSNAFQHSPPGSRVEVSLDAVDDCARIAVKDRGTGIDPSHLPRIFDRFYRGDNRYSRGLGLGLYVVRLVAEAHGGSVSVQSEPGKGSAFTLVLPLRREFSALEDEIEVRKSAVREPAATHSGGSDGPSVR
jgi:PAS domain S-box-containing protein